MELWALERVIELGYRFFFFFFFLFSFIFIFLEGIDGFFIHRKKKGYIKVSNAMGLHKISPFF